MTVVVHAWLGMASAAVYFFLFINSGIIMLLVSNPSIEYSTHRGVEYYHRPMKRMDGVQRMTCTVLVICFTATLLLARARG